MALLVTAFPAAGTGYPFPGADGTLITPAEQGPRPGRTGRARILQPRKVRTNLRTKPTPGGPRAAPAHPGTASTGSAAARAAACAPGLLAPLLRAGQTGCSMLPLPSRPIKCLSAAAGAASLPPMPRLPAGRTVRLAIMPQAASVPSRLIVLVMPRNHSSGGTARVFEIPGRGLRRRGPAARPGRDCRPFPQPVARVVRGREPDASGFHDGWQDVWYPRARLPAAHPSAFSVTHMGRTSTPLHGSLSDHGRAAPAGRSPPPLPSCPAAVCRGYISVY